MPSTTPSDDDQIRFFGKVNDQERNQPVDRFGRPLSYYDSEQNIPKPPSRSNRDVKNRGDRSTGTRREKTRDGDAYRRGSRNTDSASRGNGRGTSQGQRTPSGHRAQRVQGGGRGSKKKPSGTTLIKALVSYQYASRSIALKAIVHDDVRVNSQLVQKHNHFVHINDDIITVNGRVLLRKSVKPVTIVFNKPAGIPGSREQSAVTLYSYVTNKRNWYTPAGVLPASASGIVVVSNDKHHRIPERSTIAMLTSDFWIKVQGVVSPEVAMALPANGRVAQQNTRSTWLAFERSILSLHQLAVVLKTLHLEVLAWSRRRLGPFNTTDLPTGAWYQLDDQQVVALDELVQRGGPDTTPLHEVWASIANTIRDLR